MGIIENSELKQVVLKVSEKQIQKVLPKGSVVMEPYIVDIFIKAMFLMCQLCADYKYADANNILSEEQDT